MKIANLYGASVVEGNMLPPVFFDNPPPEKGQYIFFFVCSLQLQVHIGRAQDLLSTVSTDTHIWSTIVNVNEPVYTDRPPKHRAELKADFFLTEWFCAEGVQSNKLSN